MICAGRAGGYIAGKVAQAGYDFAIVEKHREIGKPSQCGGLVTPRVFEYVDCKETIIGSVHGAELYSPSGRRLVIDGHRTQAVVVQRAMFDRAIATDARREGAHPLPGAPAQAARPEKGGVEISIDQDGA